MTTWESGLLFGFRSPFVFLLSFLKTALVVLQQEVLVSGVSGTNVALQIHEKHEALQQTKFFLSIIPLRLWESCVNQDCSDEMLFLLEITGFMLCCGAAAADDSSVSATQLFLNLCGDPHSRSPQCSRALSGWL